MNGDNFFSLLGVSKGATETELRQAYMNKISELPTERDLLLIRTAYETLVNPRTRDQYMKIHMIDEDIWSIEREIFLSIIDENYMLAIQYIEEILSKFPSFDYLSNMLGLCYIFAGDYSKAKKIFSRLTELDQKNALYLSHLGLVYYKSEDYASAEINLVNALQLNPLDIYCPLLLADIYIMQKRFPRAVNTLETRALADGKIDDNDLPFLIKLLSVYFLMGDATEFEATFNTVKLMVQNAEGEKKKNVAFEIGTLAMVLYSVKDFEDAVQIADRALSIAKHPVIEKLLENAKKWLNIESELQKMKTNSNNTSFYNKVEEVVEMFFDAQENPDPAELMRDLSQLMNRQYIDEIIALKGKCPEVYKLLNTASNDGFERLVTENNAHNDSKPKGGCFKNTLKGCGCIVLIIIFIVILIASNS